MATVKAVEVAMAAIRIDFIFTSETPRRNLVDTRFANGVPIEQFEGFDWLTGYGRSILRKILRQIGGDWPAPAFSRGPP